MPISGFSSYLPTTDEFIAHWTSANDALGLNGPITLMDGADVAALQALRDELASRRAAVEVARNDVESVRAVLLQLKTRMLERMGQFRNKLRSISDDPRWESMMPRSYTVSEGPGRVIPPLDDMADTWARFEADTSSTVSLLGGAYSLVEFNADLDALKAAYTETSTVANALKLARANRNETQDKIYPLLKQYRQRIPAEFDEDSPILATLPRLSPLPGSTPDPVNLSGAWEETEEKAALAWSEVTDGDVTTLQLRGVAGPEYDADDESVIADFPPDTDPRQTLQSFGLGIPGAAASFKLYSLTAEGNQKGSNPVTVDRPLE